MLRHRTYVASCAWRLCRVAHWVSRTMLRACCCLSAARCSPHTKCGDAVCFLLHLACARVLLHAVCCLMHVVCCMLCPVSPSSARCLPHVAVLPCCLVAGCLLPVVNGLSQIPRCMLHAARCPLHAACCMLRCMTLLSAACCLKSGACCLLRGACCLLFTAYCPLHAACCLKSGACCLLRGACRLLLAAYCLLHGACFPDVV
jgi:hypothetical protein